MKKLITLLGLFLSAPLWAQQTQYFNTTVSVTEPRLLMSQSGAAANFGLWDIDLASGVWCLRTRTDADGAGQNAICVTRSSTTTFNNITFGANTGNPTYSFLGSGAASFGGNVTAGQFIVNGTTVPANGIYREGTNILTFATNTTKRANFDANGSFNLSGAISSAGTKFTASGCSNTTTVGGAIAGQFASGTTGTCTVTITLPTAANGWACHADDLTTPANFIGQSATSTTSCTVQGTTVSGDVIVFSAMAY